MSIRKFFEKRKARRYFLKDKRWMDYYYRDEKIINVSYVLGINESIAREQYFNILKKERGSIFNVYFSDIQMESEHYQQQAMKGLNKLFKDDSKYILQIVKRPVDNEKDIC